MRESGGLGRALAILIWILSIVVVGLGVRRWLPAAASVQGPGVDRMINFTMFAAGGFILIGHTLLGYMIWRFSRHPQALLPRASARAEKRWMILPVIVMAVVAEGGVLALGLPVWVNYYTSQAPSNALTVEIVTEQFAWNVRYAGADGKFGRTDPNLIRESSAIGLDEKDPASKDDVIDQGVVRVVLNRPVKIRLRSKDVLHSFFLPNLRVKQDSVPGMTIEFWFTPNKAGEFELACAELCGLGHWEMRGLLRVLTAEEFEKWMKEQANG